MSSCRENSILIDWLSFTSKIHSPEEIIELLGMEGCGWEVISGMHGYQERLYFNCISVHYAGRADMGVWLEMSGQGCRASALTHYKSVTVVKWTFTRSYSPQTVNLLI